MDTKTTNNTMTIIEEVYAEDKPTDPSLKRRLIDDIRRGMEYHPEVEHVVEDYLVFDKDGRRVVGACALGYAVLGQYGGEVTDMSAPKLIDRYEREVLGGDEALIISVLDWNDDKRMRIVEILEALAKSNE